MNCRYVRFLHQMSLLLLASTAVLLGGEIMMNFPKGTFLAGQEVQTSVVVIDTHFLPGAYTLQMQFDESKLRYKRVLAAQDGPFAVAPSVSVQGSNMIVAGFQGVSRAVSEPYTILAGLVFESLTDGQEMSEQYLQVTEYSVFSSNAAPIPLTFSYKTGTVLKPFGKTGNSVALQKSIQRGYVTFSLPSESIVSLTMCSLNGKVVCRPLHNSTLRTGTHAVFVGDRFAPGTYLMILKTGSSFTLQRVGVVR